ncbi:hypothetical protein [Acinetobacter baumannii]|uniref:hypothetical protein n=1 Tax=Acinetobacter baumannii TaxID=470 RepID=UPI0022EB41C2|nr:hypothetical protein [Acinetobacter baumannii]MDA3592767.1 hypothetical protein [Acinetobacter baumannii]
MKPEQFIRDFGEKKAREVIAKDQFVADLCLITPSGKLIYYKKVKGSFPEVTDFGKVELDADDYFMLELSDLKRLVESLERINKSGGLYGFKTYCNGDYSQEDLQAIRDHESIYGGGDES